MVVSDSMILLGITCLMTFLVLQKNHPIMAGFLYIATGGASYLVLAANNPYGIVIIVLGLISIITAKWGSSDR